MKLIFKNILSFLSLILIILMFTAGCASKADKKRYLVPGNSKTTLRSMDYTVQVGAYTKISNAIKVTESLEKTGIDAYYFQDNKGLYKVRFGNYSSKKSAEKEAEKLISKGVIDSYYIVKPEEYSSRRSKSYTANDLRGDIVRTAEGFIGLPYRWGGDSPDEGFDCSGLAMAVYKINGLNLPRSTTDQYDVGKPTDRSRLKKGDLVFFKISRGRKVSHVGVYKGDGSFIHAPGKGKTIRVDSLSNSYFKKRYTGARSYIN